MVTANIGQNEKAKRHANLPVWPVAKSYNTTWPLAQPLTAAVPRGCTATVVTGAVCCWNTCVASSVMPSSDTAHTFTVVSHEPLTTVQPEASVAKHDTASAWASSRCVTRPVGTE